MRQPHADVGAPLLDPEDHDAVISLAGKVDLEVSAEGVVPDSHLEFLLNEGRNRGQGFRPGPARAGTR